MPHRELTEHPLGLTWESRDTLERTAHALADDGRVWLIDPFADEEALERARGLGEIAGVLQLFAGHNRDGQAIASRFSAPFLQDPRPGAGLAVLGPEPRQARVEGTRALVAGAQGADRRRVDRRGPVVRGRSGAGGRARDPPGAAAQHAALLPARAPADGARTANPRRRGDHGAQRSARPFGARHPDPRGQAARPRTQHATAVLR